MILIEKKNIQKSQSLCESEIFEIITQKSHQYDVLFLKFLDCSYWLCEYCRNSIIKPKTLMENLAN